MYNNSPYKDIPHELLKEYTQNNKIPILNWYRDDSKPNGVVWTNKFIEDHICKFTPTNIKLNKEGISPYGHEVVEMLLFSFIKYNIKEKNVAVVGSETPWIEAILLNLSNKVTTIEYNVPENITYNNLSCKSYFDFFVKNTNEFDCIISFSSIEHSGLGRYGDPLDPNGDIKTMKTIHNNLKENGLLIWGAPVGHDALVWNVHRIYGALRLPLIFEGFKELEWIKKNKNELLNTKLQKEVLFQPVVVLCKV